MSARSGLRNTLDFSGDAVYMEEVYSELGGSIIVEHCKDCARHASTTRHDERKYKQYFDALEQLVGRCFPNCEIEANPPAVLKRITGSKAPRLGSFEVYVANEDGSNKQARPCDILEIPLITSHPRYLRPPHKRPARSPILRAAVKLQHTTIAICIVSKARFPCDGNAANTSTCSFGRPNDSVADAKVVQLASLPTATPSLGS